MLFMATCRRPFRATLEAAAIFWAPDLTTVQARPPANRSKSLLEPPHAIVAVALQANAGHVPHFTEFVAAQ